MENVCFSLMHNVGTFRTFSFRIAFERALDIQNDNVCALSALAILDYNTHTIEGAQSAVVCLGQAYSLEPENPVVLIHLANHFFFKGVIFFGNVLQQMCLFLGFKSTIVTSRKWLKLNDWLGMR